MRLSMDMEKFSNIIILALLIILPAGELFAGDWPQWRYDAARSATSPNELPEQLHLQWVLQLPTPRPAWPSSQPSLRFDVSYSPVAAGELLFVPSMVTDSVTAYETDSGTERWRFFAGGPVRLAPVYNNGKVYFGSDDGYFYCLSAADGKLIWKFRGGPSDRKVFGNERLISSWPVRGGPVLKDGVIYFTAGIWPFMGIFVHAVDAETGKNLWTNSGDSITYQTNPHNSPAFGGFVPRGHLAITKKGLRAPGGRTPPGTYDLKTGRLIAFNFAQFGGRSSHGAVAIRAGSKTYTPDDCKAIVEGTPWNLLAADDKLFVVTTAGRIYCFGAKKAARGFAMESKYTAKPQAAYVVIFGLGSVEEIESLVGRSNLHLIVIDPDAEKIDALRRRMVEAGLYGIRVSAHVGNPITYHLPPYMAESAVVHDFPTNDTKACASHVKAVFSVLRPYGGTARLPIGAERLRQLVKQAVLAGAKVKSSGGNASVLVREGPLPGAADWTHNYAGADNSVVSKDKLVKTPLGLLWFGNGPPNDEVLPRHGHGPSPQVAAGRLFIEGAEMLRATDIYTGRLLWQRELPGLGKFYDNTNHQPGAGEIGSNYVSLADSVYVVYGDVILDLDAATGKTKNEIRLKPTADGSQPNWGGIAAWNEFLIATATPVKINLKSDNKTFTPVRYSSASRRLVVMDRHTGKVLWDRNAVYGFRHNNIAVGAGKVFCIDGLSTAKLNVLKRRGIDRKGYKPRLMALDVCTGREIWSTTTDIFGTFLGYSAEHDVLLQAGSLAQDRAYDESPGGMAAYRGADGSVLWKDLDRRYSGPCMLRHDAIIAQGPAWSLTTGKQAMRKHPITGVPMKWKFTRNYGCNTATACEHLVLFRSAAAGFYDLTNNGGTGNLGGFKSGCTSNLIAAGGVLSAPEYTRTCTCNYQNQTSLALIHDPSAEVWTFNSFKWDGNPVRRVGINFGAPGDRRANNRTLWLDFPSVGGPSPDIPVEVQSSKVNKPRYYRYHASRVEADADAGELNWVAASGIEGLTQVTLTLSKYNLWEATPSATDCTLPVAVRDASHNQKAPKYTVRLHFAEVEDMEPGRRVFDILLQGNRVLDDFDVVREADGRNRAVVKEFRGIEAPGKLNISLAPAGDIGAILSGIEVVAE